MVLHRWQEGLGYKGHYLFPFTIVLPPTAPGSFSYTTNMIEGLIKYELIAIFICDPEPITLRKEIQIIQTQTENIVSLSTTTISRSIK